MFSLWNKRIGYLQYPIKCSWTFINKICAFSHVLCNDCKLSWVLYTMLQDPYVTASNCFLSQVALVLYDMSNAITILAEQCRCASHSHEHFKFYSTTQSIPTSVNGLWGCGQIAIPSSVEWSDKYGRLEHLACGLLKQAALSVAFHVLYTYIIF